MLKRTDEEKVAKAAEKERQREQADRQRAASAEQQRLRNEAEQRENARRAFVGSPAGQARTAFERGDRVFQFYMDVKNTKPVVMPMVGATTTTRTADPVVILNSVCHEGWDVVNGSFVFHELGSESRDKFLASGQNVAVRGTIIGYYLFRRSEANKIKTNDPWAIAGLERHCPACGQRMDASRRTCPACGNDSDPWQHHEGRWWNTVNGEWHVLDEQTAEWGKWEQALETDSDQGG